MSNYLEHACWNNTERTRVASCPRSTEVPVKKEQLLWTGADVGMKITHTALVLAWRATQRDIDAIISVRTRVSLATRDLCGRV